ncbi:MAG: UDP-N-acetylmuramoyl-L-alanine--D-glutamate ligase [Bacteroidales bacterium]|nr:UDP-N-acetylmuramoyl-L-alanine--D-glutamate ligase [Bacteroidales bacterium]
MVILGAGESGVGSAILAKSKNFEVFVSDNGSISQKYKDLLINNDIDWEEGGHTEIFILNADLIIKSPGIPENVPIIKKIVDKKIKIISEIEFAGSYTNAKMICVTGSNGKTTTTLMIYHLLKKAGLNVGVAGNVGKSFALQVAQNSFNYYVVELSSFQLDGMYEFKPDVAIIMNITPDHLNRYDNVFQNYVNSKFRITQNLTPNDYLIYCSDDEVVTNGLNKRNINTNKLPFSLSNKDENGAYVENNNIIINMTNNNFIMSIQDLALQGKHNTYNSMAAGLTGKVLKIRKEIIRESLADFQGVEHRLEPVIKVHGIEFINDSKATNVNSTWYALETMTKPIVWIVGGIDKGNDYSILTDLVKSKVKAIVCLGVDNKKIHKAFSEFAETIVDTSSVEEAVSAAYYLAEKGEVVLLSPACASFDLFDNYEDRGRKFKNSVRDL